MVKWHEEDRHEPEGMGQGTQLGSHLHRNSLLAKFRRHASWFSNPQTILNEAGYNGGKNADGYSKEEAEAINSR